MNLLVEDYSEKSFAVFGNIALFRNKLTELGGTENQYLKRKTTGVSTAGFVFPNFKRKVVEDFVETANKSDALDTVVKQPVKVSEKTDDDKKFLHQLLARVEKLEAELANLKKIVFKTPLSASSSSQSFKSKKQDVNSDSDSDSDSEEKVVKKPERLLSRK